VGRGWISFNLADERPDESGWAFSITKEASSCSPGISKVILIDADTAAQSMGNTQYIRLASCVAASCSLLPGGGKLTIRH
jgi:hypothetical protein